MSQAKRARRGRRRSQRSAPGSSPGQLVVDPSAAQTRLRVISYGPEAEETRDLVVGEIRSWLGRRPVTWVDVQGLGDADLLAAVGKALDIHPLALEDVVNTHQRPKIEEYGQQVFIVMRMTRPDELRTEQLALVLGPNYVVTFQEERGDGFDPVRERIRREGSRLRRGGPDYLTYALLDAATDGYFPLLDGYADRLEQLEETVLTDYRQKLMAQLYELRRELQTLRRYVWPLRELLGRLTRGDLPLVGEGTAVFFRDCHDHADQLLDAVDNSRDHASELIEVWLGMGAQRMNEIMKVLTIMASVFIPLTFIAGIYGMNFDPEVSPWNMPELGARWGYPLALLAMVLTAVAMLLFFRRRGWLGEPGPASPGAGADGPERDRRERREP